MKKNLFFVAVVAAALAGCSSDESLSNVNEGTIANGDLVPVELGLSRGIVDVYQTRGTGTVGAIDKQDNDYNCENLYVLMTDNDAETWGFTTFGTLDRLFDGSFYSRAVWDGTSMTTDEDDNEVKVWAIDYLDFNGGQVKYYPADGRRSDFFAFYVDDAALDETGATTDVPVILPEEDPDADPDPEAVNEKYVEFEIDGSQDILAGKAFYPEGVVGGFSAKTARKGIKPRIPMKHMLTRLTFSVQPNATAEGVKINSIQVTSEYKGQLTVAYKEEGTKDAEDLIAWTGDSTDFTLGTLVGDRTNGLGSVEGTKTALTYPDPLYTISADDVVADGEGNFAKKPVGEAMFVRPNQTYYTLKINYDYPIEGYTEETMNFDHEATIKLPNDAVMEDGYSYNVNIKIYGLEEIFLETTLEAWKDGGEAIEIDPDADDEAEADPDQQQDPDPQNP